jgi:cobalt-zinc-cadmium efflux system membrane fusion protein
MSIPESVIDILSKEPEGEIVPFEVRDPFPAGRLTQFEVLAPFDGVLIEKNIAQGSVAQRYDVLFRISDLSLLWVDARVTSEQLRFLDPQASVTIRSQAMGLETEAKVSSVGAALDPETQSTYARIELPNVDGQWKAGAYVEVVSHHEAVAPVAVALSAVQYLDSRPAVFVRHAEGWEARAVALGRQDRQFVEILSGVKAGEEYASDNSFILKAELGKGEAEHDH